MMWHRRETRRQTEKTKLNLQTGSNLPTHPIRNPRCFLLKTKLDRILRANDFTAENRRIGAPTLSFDFNRAFRAVGSEL
jgi:hypothetical protein